MSETAEERRRRGGVYFSPYSALQDFSSITDHFGVSLQLHRSMAELALFFSGSDSPQLQSILYFNGQAAIRSERTGGTYTPFEWTLEAKALSVLLVRSAATGRALIEGRRGSLAASLDEALEKLSPWLLEMFGADTDGEPIALKMIKRTNPGRRRPGPVALTLRQSLLPPSSISVYRDGVRVRRPEELNDLAQSIEATIPVAVSSPKGKLIGREPSTAQEVPMEPRTDREWLTELVRDQASTMLGHTEIFDRRRLAAQLRRIVENPYFKKLSGNIGQILCSDGIASSTSRRLGIVADELGIRRALCRDTPLNVAVPAVLAGPVVILKYLTLVKGYNLSINYRFPHSTDLLQSVSKNRIADLFDCCVLSVGNTAALLGAQRTEYRPLMLLPGERYAIVSPREEVTGRLPVKEYLFITEAPSAQAYFFEHLRDQGVIATDSAFTCIHAEPDEATAALMSGDKSLGAVLCFPHYHFNSLFNDCSIRETGDTSNFLCCHDRLWRDPERLIALEVAIRDAWIELSLNPALLRRVVEALVSEDYFCSVVTRAGGLHYIPQSRRSTDTGTFSKTLFEPMYALSRS